MWSNRKYLVGFIFGAVLFVGIGLAFAQGYLGEVSQGVGGKKGAWLVGGSDGTTMRPLSVTATGALNTTGGGSSAILDGNAPDGGYTATAIAGIDRSANLFHTVSVDSTGAVKTSGGSIAFAPGVPTAVTLSASTSASLCSLTAGADYEIACNVAVAWRHGAATPTATLNDTQLAASVTRTPVRMPTGSTCFAFISSSAGTCWVSLIPTS